MKRALLLLALVAALVGGAYFLAQAAEAAAEDAFAVLSMPSAWLAVVIGSLMFSLSYLPSAYIWRRLLLWRGIEVAPVQALALLLRTIPAKYLPGNVAQPMGRAAGLALAGAPLRSSVPTLIEEAALSLGAAFFLGLAAASVVSASYPDAMASALPWTLVALSLGAVAVLSSLAMDGGLQEWAVSISPVGRPVRILSITAGYAVVMLLIGSAMWISSFPVTGVNIADWALILSAFLIAWTVGSLVPGAPAGLGVRDAAMVWMLSPHFAESAVVIAAVARLTTVLGDGLAFLAGLLLLGQGTARKQ